MSLTTPAAEVETYAQLWELRPFLDQQAMDVIVDSALAAQTQQRKAAFQS